MTHKAEYMQILSLPGPVQVDKMKVDRKEGVLTVTLPKA
ncbi:MAG: Hsp20/alpha crystallin family protein [Luteolibacter sp.]